jgi:DNA-directed RNA polymerase subunit H (RpoH/RPB5)
MATIKSSTAQQPAQASMQMVPQLLPIEKNSESKKNIVLTNIIKMLTERGLLDYSKQNQYIKQLIGTQSDDQTYKVDLDYPEKAYSKDNRTMIIRLINQKITSISKSSGISDLLTTYKMQPKIIVVTSINSRTRYQVQSDQASYPNTEIFLEKELLINIVDHVSQPKFTLLTEEETKLVLDAYHAKRRDIPKILFTDPISCYYNAKSGQLFRIIRPSETSGEAVSYRLVIKGQIRDV